MCDSLLYLVIVYIDAAPITGLVETRSGLAWSRPVNAIECSFDYMVTDDDDSELIMTDDISYNGTFPVCHNQTITVTPMVPITGQELTSSSASITGIFNSSAGKCIGGYILRGWPFGPFLNVVVFLGRYVIL